MYDSDYSVPTILRFWSKVDFAPVESCWIWKDRGQHHGHGRFTVRHGTHTPAHRFAYEIANHCSVLEEFHVGHLCDNPPCVNPGHLEIQSPIENVEQRVRNGRTVCGDSHVSSKLTGAQVLAIRERYEAGETQTAIATEYGVSQTQISKITLRRSWKHV